MFVLELDFAITRRQYLNHIRDDEGNLRFSSQRSSECFDWLFSHGIRRFWLTWEDKDGGTHHIDTNFGTAQLDQAVAK